MSLTARMTGWHLDYIRAVPLYQLLQLVAGWLTWEGNELRWAHAGVAPARLAEVLDAR